MRTALLALACTILAALPARADYPWSFTRTEITGGVHVFSEPSGHAIVSGNIVAIVGDDAVAVVDTGHHPRLTREITGEIRRLAGKPVRYVVNTHWHNDHVSGNAAEADVAQAECGEFRYRGPDATFTDRMTLRLGNRDVELIHPGRANTAGDVIAWIPDARIVVTGDIVVHPFPYATQSYVSEWAAALRRIEALPFEMLVPGHGPVMRDRRYPGDLAAWRKRFAGDDRSIGVNFDNMVGDLAVGRAWQELAGRFEPEGLPDYH